MLLTGEETEDTYGQLRELNSGQEATNFTQTGFSFRLDQGLTILKAQRVLYRFLLR